MPSKYKVTESRDGNPALLSRFRLLSDHCGTEDHHKWADAGREPSGLRVCF